MALRPVPGGTGAEGRGAEDGRSVNQAFIPSTLSDLVEVHLGDVFRRVDARDRQPGAGAAIAAGLRLALEKLPQLGRLPLPAGSSCAFDGLGVEHCFSLLGPECHSVRCPRRGVPDGLRGVEQRKIFRAVEKWCAPCFTLPLRGVAIASCRACPDVLSRRGAEHMDRRLSGVAVVVLILVASGWSRAVLVPMAVCKGGGAIQMSRGSVR